MALVEKYWWHVNKTGFPIKEETWKKMWDYIIATHPDGAGIAMSICERTHKKLPTPSLPVVSMAYTTQENMLAVQRYMEELQYNHTGTQFFDIKKARPLFRSGCSTIVCHVYDFNLQVDGKCKRNNHRVFAYQMLRSCGISSLFNSTSHQYAPLCYKLQIQLQWFIL